MVKNLAVGSIGSETDAYEKNNGVDDARNGRCFREGKKEAKIILNSRSRETNTK
jgi:hypothetical protein